MSNLKSNLWYLLQGSAWRTGRSTSGKKRKKNSHRITASLHGEPWKHVTFRRQPWRFL